MTTLGELNETLREMNALPPLERYEELVIIARDFAARQDKTQ